MIELIDRAVLKRELEEDRNIRCEIRPVLKRIDAQPTVMHQKRGQWLDADDRPSSYAEKEDGRIIVEEASWCSECHWHLAGSGEWDVNGNFCPRCGAKMNGEAQYGRHD